ncbi:hypothetical protein THAOC_36284 [Thalassiosira oceanica]|uniref:Uncharacterized protein n=1 Tax=Thalassiosira oceanica TaxID=159749 RepID=K0R8K6_THAOC|nr:hypothetical protein THAOC_36284 [Thalassiosira oceanica]|eukprot:EJK45116.1 hypothetical protein THAOC_36284 [Thalassiosira oceanica]
MFGRACAPKLSVADLQVRVLVGDALVGDAFRDGCSPSSSGPRPAAARLAAARLGTSSAGPLSAGPLRPTEPTTRMIRTLTLTKRRMGWAGWRKGDVDDGLESTYRQWDGSDLVVLVGAQVSGA